MTVAENVTVLPTQEGLFEAVIEIPGDEICNTFILIEFDVAGLFVTHVSTEVTWQITESPLTGI